ncbi:hypothetical protein M758_8G166500 [Ceratodon purpureus]|uniref:Uncharacterized protein n=1 Tax=Ceratodon purpureus TaxID=3225 RepID=A0A8T0H207_CERPU|nr:hypothetical protein KC19_N022900 [Ceratodon purpureus]KAG0565193.1 hypothetical protein KC19_8G171900 [Ceratodon purpureus]KAG0609208.1 hypothetical protein M758_8G166500 [Ceratodon purpureus]
MSITNWILSTVCLLYTKHCEGSSEARPERKRWLKYYHLLLGLSKMSAVGPLCITRDVP